MSKGTILIIEDNPQFQKIYGDRLTVDGYEVLHAPDGKAGLVLARSRPLNLVVTDLNMPVMDGYALIEEMKKDPALARIPILVMSVFDTPEAVTRARALGADDYIIKGTATPHEVSAKVTALAK